jgi:hypothetical protein
MNENIEKIIRLKLGKEIERINFEVEGKRRIAIADLNRRGVLQSGMTVKMMLDTGFERIERLVRSHYAFIKEAHLDSGEQLTPEGLRSYSKIAEKTLENSGQRLIEETTRRVPAIRDIAKRMGSETSHGIERIRAAFRRDVEIEAATLEMQDAQKSQTPLPKPPTLNSSEYQYDVFISFTTSDKAIGEQIQQCLSDRKVRAFFSPKDLQSGDDWAEVIRNALVGSREICLVISKQSLTREWVLTEWGAGWALERRITPILVDCQVQDLPARLQGKQCVNIQDLSRYVDDVCTRSGS